MIKLSGITALLLSKALKNLFFREYSIQIRPTVVDISESSISISESDSAALLFLYIINCQKSRPDKE